MAFSAAFIGPGGINPEAAFLAVRNAVQTTVGDLLYAGQILRTKITQRTLGGLDANGSPFQEYSPKYAAKKTKELGHSRVDLFGFARGAHMLNAMLVKAGSQEAIDFTGGPEVYQQPADRMQLGIYNEELAVRAQVHNEGAQIRSRLGIGSTDVGGQYPLFTQGKPARSGKTKATKAAYFGIPQRRFFAANAEDLSDMEQGIGQRQMARLEALPK